MEFARQAEYKELALVGEEASSVQHRLDETTEASRLLEMSEAEVRRENEELRLCCERLAVEAVEAKTGQRAQADACAALQESPSRDDGRIGELQCMRAVQLRDAAEE